MDVYLIDGTYELFRHYFGVPKALDDGGQEIGAVRGVVNSIYSLLKGGATHVGVATDHVIESFRNELYPYYKTSAGVPDDLMSQFPILEEALTSMGILVWPMVEFEADDALAAASARAAEDERVGHVFVCTPDKDLCQAVVGTRVVQLDRRKKATLDESGVIAKFGVKPKSIPDYLALVGDTADGYPGLSGWGAKASSAVLSVYDHLELIPKNPAEWDVTVRGKESLSATLASKWSEVLLFRTLATLRLDVPVFETVDALRWQGAQESFIQVCARLKMPDLLTKIQALRHAGSSQDHERKL